jgi:hypothetical protein
MNRDTPLGKQMHFLLQFTGFMPVMNCIQPGCHKMEYNKCFHVGSEQKLLEINLPKPINPDNHAI